MTWKTLKPFIHATNLDNVVFPAPLTPINSKWPCRLKSCTWLHKTLTKVAYMKPYSPTNNGYESCQQASTSILYGIYAIGLLVSSWFQLLWHSVENLSKWCSTTAKKSYLKVFRTLGPKIPIFNWPVAVWRFCRSAEHGQVLHWTTPTVHPTPLHKTPLKSKRASIEMKQMYFSSHHQRYL